MSSGCMQGESGSWITWLPIAFAGIGLNLWILWYLLFKWPGATGQPLPLYGYIFSVVSALLLFSLLFLILNAMFGSVPENRLYTIFKSLQKDDLIDKKRKLQKTRFTPQIQGIFRKIRYNERFYYEHLSKLSDIQLKFVLLHEEGHIKTGSIKEYIWIFIFILGGVILFIWPINGFFDFVFMLNGQSYSISGLGALFIQIFSVIIYILVFLSLLYRLSYKMMYNAEFLADEYAAENLKNEYGVEHPSVVMKQTFDCILSSYKLGILGNVSVIILKIIGFYPGYHPSEVERVQNIMNKFE